MNNIDKLKEKIEKDYKDMMAVINSTSLPLFVEDTIEDMHILIKTLIAENKELKEKNNVLKQEKEYLECIVDSDEDNYIPKSKLKAKIEEVEQWGLYNMKIPKLSTLDERLGAKIGIKYVLQSLLGKE